MIKELKQMAAGTEVRGLPLMIKTARSTVPMDDGVWQEVLFMDSSGEMSGLVLLDADRGNVPWKSKTNLCIMEAALQDTDERKKEGVKLVVTECFDAATPLSYDQQQDLQAEDWRQMREDEIRGKIKHGLSCAFVRGIAQATCDMPKPDKTTKEAILEWTEFIMTGE